MRINRSLISAFDADKLFLILMVLSLVFYDTIFYGKILPSIISYLFLAIFILFFLKIRTSFDFNIRRTTLIISLFLLIFFQFFVSSLFDFSGPVVVTDNPYYFEQSYSTYRTFGNKVTQIYESDEFYDLHEPIPFLYGYYSRMQVFTMAFYHLLFNINIAVLFRFFILISFIMVTFGVFLLTEKLSGSSNTAFISSLLFVSTTHHQLITGQASMYLATGLSFIILYSYYKFKAKQHFLSPLLFIILWLHPFIFVLTLIAYIIIFLMDSEKNIRAFSATFFPVVITLTAFAILVYQTINRLTTSTTFSHVMSLYDTFIFIYLRNSFAVFLLGFIGVAYIKDKRWFLLIGSLFLLIFVDVIFQYPIKMYVSFYMRTFLCVFAGIFLVGLFTQKRDNLLKAIALSIVIIDIIFYQFYLFQVWSNPNDGLFEYVNGRTFYEMEKLNLTDGIFAFQPNPHFVELINFVDTNNNGKYRFLIEASVNRKWGGYVLGLLSFYTNASVLTNPYLPSVQYDNDYSYNSRDIYDSIIFAKNINNYTIEEFEENLERFRIKYIVAWTDDFNRFLDFHYNEFRLLTSTSDGFANMYEYINSKEYNETLKSGLIDLTFWN